MRAAMMDVYSERDAEIGARTRERVGACIRRGRQDRLRVAATLRPLRGHAPRALCLWTELPEFLVPAAARLEMTIAMRASGILPEATFFAIISKLEPRPERSMPRFFISHST